MLECIGTEIYNVSFSRHLWEDEKAAPYINRSVQQGISHALLKAYERNKDALLKTKITIFHNKVWEKTYHIEVTMYAEKLQTTQDNISHSYKCDF